MTRKFFDTPPPAPDAAARAQLEAMSARSGQNGMRARIVLALARGETPTRIVKSLGITYATVRAARRRFATGGAAALATRLQVRHTAPPPEGEEALRLRTGVPDVLLAREAAEKRRGRLPAARLAIETWARDAVALGAVAPGALFPPRRSVQKAFRTTSAVVQGAFASLARQGFARNVPGGGSHAPDKPPFEGRYLFVGSTSDDMRVGYMAAVRAAAARLTAARGVRFEIADSALLQSPSEKRTELLADMRSQRWAGVFIRTWTSEMDEFGPVRLDNVPICLVKPRSNHHASFRGSRVSKIAGPSAAALMGPLLSVCAAAGGRRVAVLDHQGRHTGFQAGDVARLAAERGLELGPWHYQATKMIGETEGTRDAIQAIVTAMLAPGRDWTPDCVVLMDDHWLGPLEGALHTLGTAPESIVVACLGNRPALPATRLDVHFHGYDLEATLASFVDWCDAIHAGAPSPPPPALATF